MKPVFLLSTLNLESYQKLGYTNFSTPFLFVYNELLKKNINAEYLKPNYEDFDSFKLRDDLIKFFFLNF